MRRGLPDAAILRRFIQLANVTSLRGLTTKPPGQGSGLGLAIVQRLVLHAQGAIHLSSRPGEGSTFTLCIPLQQQE